MEHKAGRRLVPALLQVIMERYTHLPIYLSGYNGLRHFAGSRR